MSNGLEWRKAIRDSNLDPTAKHVALTLDIYMNRRGIAWPAQTSLAEGTGRSKTTVHRALGRLERGGFLIIARSPGKRSNLYHALIPNRVTGATVEISPTVSNGASTVSNRPLNPGVGATLSRKEAFIRSRTPDDEKTETNEASLELARRWLAAHTLPA